MNNFKEIEEKYYRNNPKQEVRDKQNFLLDMIVPVSIGGAIGAIGAIKSPKAYQGIKRLIPTNISHGIAAGAAFGSAPLLATHEGLRRKKILKSEGIDSSIIGSFFEPYKTHILNESRKKDL